MKLKKEIKLFFKESKLISIFAFIFLTIYISYGLTNNVPEIFPGANYVYTLIKDLCLAFIGSYIFYIVQVYIPLRLERREISILIRKDFEILSHSIDHMTHFIKTICKTKYNLELDSLILDSKEIDLTSLDNPNNINNIAIKGFVNLNSLENDLNKINMIINKCFSLNINLEYRTLSLLYRIKESFFLTQLSRYLEKNSINSEDRLVKIDIMTFCKFLKLYNELVLEIKKYESWE